MRRTPVVFGIVFLLVACGLWPVDCAPSWDNKPDNPIYVLDSNAVTLPWQYRSDGLTMKGIQWTVTIPGDSRSTVIVRKSQDGNTIIASAYGGRLTQSGNAAITLRDVKPADTGKYECDIDFGGFDVLNHQTEMIVVVKPEITDKTNPVTLVEGQGQILKCTASGNPKPTITWYKGGTELTLNDPSTTDYVINNAQRKDGGTYTCMASVRGGNQLGPYVAQYTVDVTIQFKPQIDSPPQNSSVDENSNVQFTCEAVGNPNVVSYKWFDKNNNLISDGAKYAISRSGQRSILQISNVEKDDAGAYKCTGANTIGEGKGAFGYLTVNYGPKEVKLTSDPAGDKDKGGSVTFTCQADGYPAPTYSWKFNGVYLSNSAQSKLSFSNLDRNQAGNYTCVAENTFGSKEENIVLNVRYKPTTTEFSAGRPNNEVIKGSKVTVTCSADGYPPPTFTIKRNGVDVKTDVQPGVHVINSVPLADDDVTFSCTPRNEKGTGPEKQFKLVVLVAPEFVTSPSNLPETKTENENISYSCHAEGKPPPSIIWQLDGKNLTSVPPYIITRSIVPQANKIIIAQGRLDIVGITWRQNGTYTCTATNSAGTGHRTTVLNVRHRPVVKNAADHPKNKTVEAAESVTFHCKAIGNPVTTKYQWQFEGVNITDAIYNWYDLSTVTSANEGRYSCLAYNSLGWGPPADAYLFIKSPPKIISHTTSGKRVNETHNVTLECRVSGVPRPDVTWTKIGSSQRLHVGEEFTIHNVADSDKGTYRCTATNEKGTDSKEIQLIVQVAPTIITSTPDTTQVPDENGQAQMTCTVKGEPLPLLSWTRPNDNHELNQGDPRVVEIAYQSETSVLKVIVDRIGEKYSCSAVNELGKDKQEYTIRRKGFPDKPIDIRVRGIVVAQATTVNVNVSWTPGYSGGYSQTFKVKYRETELNGPFTTSDASNTPIRTVFTVTGLKPETEYEFRVQAQNERGAGEMSNSVLLTTPKSAEPPPRATVSVKRTGDETAVVTWKVNDNNVNYVDVQYREKDGTWKTAASDLDPAKEEYTITGLTAEKTYEFRLLLKEQTDSVGSTVYYSKKVPPLSTPPEANSSPLSQDAMIAIIAAVAGVLLVALVVLALCCFRRRKKPYGGDQAVEMNQTDSYPYQGYAAGGPADVNHGTNRRSYGMESVEDDPFIEAHFASQQSMASSDAGKKKPTNVNYGYMSQDSFQPQPQEMLLNPGSRLSRNARLTQSTGELEGVGFQPRGSKRDFSSTLPPYHDPPSFEEAMRQCSRKPRTRKSTGDLVDGRTNTDGSGRQSGRRARQSRPADEPTDSSDAEPRYTRRSAPAVRPLESDDDHAYAPVEPRKGHDRRPLPVPTVNSGPRQTPDPDVPYAKPMKKSKPRQPRAPRAEPAIGPPPQYTPEDRSLERDLGGARHAPQPGGGSRPMVTDLDLDLDDPSGAPELPPPMLSDNELDTDNLPEPPVFLRDDRGPRSSRGNGYGPPDTRSSNRANQPYVNIHGQLVRPGSSRPDLRRSNHSLEPEPEVPSSQGPPQPESNGPEVNYVSYLV